MRIPVSLTLLLAVVSMPAWARGTIDKVHIRGLEDSPAMENNVRLALGVTSVVGKVQGESRLELLLFNAEREARQALEPFGYYSPGIQVDSPRNASDRITVTVRIDRGQPVRVRQSDVSIVGPGGDDPYLARDLEAFRPGVGEVFDHATYDASRDGISRRLAERGYFDADFLTREVQVTRADQAADIDLAWDSGFRYDMGPTVFHQQYFRPGLLDKLVTWEEGSYFHQGKLDRLRQSLVRLDYFSAIDIQARPQDASDDLRVPVDVNLVLAKRSVYSAGLSYGSESGMGVRFGLERRYVNSRGHKLVTDLDYARNRKNLLVQYRMPAFAWLDGWYSASLQAADEQTDYVNSRRLELVGSRSGQYNDHLNLVASLHVLRERWAYASVTRPTPDFQYASFVYPSLRAEYIDVDERMAPRRGGGATLTLRGGKGGADGRATFTQLHASVQWFHGLDASSRLLARGELGHTFTRDVLDLPPSLRFYAGGDRSVRGYGWHEIGPSIRTNGGTYFTGAPNVVTASLEYERFIRGPWGMAVFVDTGSAFEGRDADLHTGVGIGLRWRSPVGPVRVDIARGLNAPDSPITLHLNIGADL